MARRINDERECTDGEVWSYCGTCWHMVAVGLDDPSWGAVAPCCEMCAGIDVGQVPDRRTPVEASARQALQSLLGDLDRQAKAFDELGERGRPVADNVRKVRQRVVELASDAFPGIDGGSPADDAERRADGR